MKVVSGSSRRMANHFSERLWFDGQCPERQIKSCQNTVLQISLILR